MFKKISLLLVFLVLSVSLSWAADGRFTLVIDPGHGGHDAGAIGAISKEKDINLNIALAFGRYVERNLPDVNVIYTRKTDVFILGISVQTSPIRLRQTFLYPYIRTLWHQVVM